jgi:two-component system, sensor histidine kinase RegB
VRLRWAQIAGQALTVAVAHFVFRVHLPLLPLLALISIALISNIWIELRYVSPSDTKKARVVDDLQIAIIMALDISLLTGLLYLTGGPRNPFGLLYVVQIALAAVALRALWTWALVGFSFLGFGILLLGSRNLEMSSQLMMVGTWVAIGVASAFVVLFLLRIMAALAQRDQELADARSLAARQERLASLATMAAGAAHELSTPLGTVALAAKELERALRATDRIVPNEELAADALLIREQVGRCRVILDQMAQGAGTVGEGLATCTVRALIDDIVQGVRTRPPVIADIISEAADTTVRLPRVAVAQSLRSLVTNAQDAAVAASSSNPASVNVHVERRQGRLVVRIVDQGVGMGEDVLARVGEPFFTTKSPGQGMGLGMFLARAVIEGVGGTLTFESSTERGTTARVELPVDATDAAVG